MIKPIVKDIFFLRRKAEEATREDIQVGIDLQDTLRANREACVGMAANMIGVNKRVIIVNMGFVDENIQMGELSEDLRQVYQIHVKNKMKVIFSYSYYGF